MNLYTSLLLREMQAGGPGSGCHGDNCGRPKGLIPLPKTRFSISRKDMPQIRGLWMHHYLNWLKNKGIGHSYETVQPQTLKPVQKTISRAIGEGLKQSGPNLHGRPVVISKDSYILDGHHRWDEALQEGVPLRVVRIGLGMGSLLKTTATYPHAETRSSSHGLIPHETSSSHNN
jgi:hypothetical protein